VTRLNTIGSRLSLLIGATGTLLLVSWGAMAYGERRVSGTVQQIQDELRHEQLLEKQDAALVNLGRPGNDVLETWDVDVQESRLESYRDTFGSTSAAAAKVLANDAALTALEATVQAQADETVRQATEVIRAARARMVADAADSSRPCNRP
jgi:hypothetical protein